jgi:hypothetical protein
MSAFIGKIFFEREIGASPGEYNRICEVFSISGLGKTKSLVDVTTFCSNGVREYIPGLADGQEMTVELNYDTESSDIDLLIADVGQDANVDYRVVVESGGSPAKIFSFAGVPLSWVLNPSVDNRNTITVTIKISGDITITS